MIVSMSNMCWNISSCEKRLQSETVLNEKEQKATDRSCESLADEAVELLGSSSKFSFIYARRENEDDEE